MLGIELCLPDSSSPSSRLILRNLVLLRHLGLGVDSEIIAPKWERVLGASFASRHWKCFLLTSAFCPSPPHAACPVSWRYWSLPRPVGRRRTLGDLYAPVSWRQGACLGVFLHVGCSEPVPASACASLLWDCPCLLHVGNSDLTCTVCMLACRFGRREPGVFLGLGPRNFPG